MSSQHPAEPVAKKLTKKICQTALAENKISRKDIKLGGPKKKESAVINMAIITFAAASNIGRGKGC